MSILNWLKSMKSGKSMDTPTLAPGEEEFHGLDMSKALNSHNAWVSRLEKYIHEESEEVLEVGQVACDDCCALGQWITGEAKNKFGKIGSFHDLKTIHTEFHKQAGFVLIEAQSGQKDVALEKLHDLHRKSGEVQIALVTLFSEARG